MLSTTTTSSDSKSSSVDQRVPIAWKPVAPDGGYGWVVVFGAFLIHVFADGFVYSFGVIGQSLVDKYGYSNSEVSTIISLLSGLMYAIGIFAAVMCNKIGCRKTAVIGALLSAAGCGVSYFATRLVHLVFSIGVVMGVGLGLLYCPAIVIVTMYFEKNRSLATGITVCGSGVGTLGFAKLIAYFITLLEPDLLAIFPIYGGILLLCIPCGLLFKPVPLEPIYEEDDEQLALKHKKSESGRKEASCQLSFRQAFFNLRKVPNFSGLYLRRVSNFLGLYLLFNPCYMVYLVSSVLVTVGFNAAPMFLPMNAEAVLNKEKQQAANAVSFYGFANVLGRLFFGWICDRKLPFKWGKNHENNRLWIYTAALILSGLSACLVFAMHNFIVYVAFCSFFGFMVSSYAALTSVLLVDLIGIDLMTTGLGLLLLFHGGACIAGPVIGGYLFDITKDYGWTFALIGGCLLVGGMILPVTHSVPGRYILLKEQPQTEENVVLMKSMPEKDINRYIDSFANVLGRLFFGWICDRKLPFKWGKNHENNRLWIYTAALILSGLSACLVFAMHNFIVYVAFCSFFGFMVSSYAALTSVLLVDLIGIDLMTTGLGLLLLFHGGACIAGPVIGGYLFDITKDYGWTFALIGGCLLVGGMILPVTHSVPGRYILLKEQPQTEENVVLMKSMPEKDINRYIDSINVLNTI